MADQDKDKAIGKIGRKELCEDLNISSITVTRWIKDGCPHTVEGKQYFFDREAVAKWIEENGRTLKKGRKPLESTEEKKQLEIAILRTKDKKVKVDLEKSQIDLQAAEIELKKTKSELFSKQEIEEGRIARIGLVKNGLLGLPTSIAPSLVGLKVSEIQNLLESEMHKLLEWFSKQ